MLHRLTQPFALVAFLIGAIGVACSPPAVLPPAVDMATCAGAMCGGACVDTMTSAAHCGGCGMACEQGFNCVAGKCALGCPKGQMVCGKSCASLMADPQNCGACAIACKGNEVCSMGKCEVTCAMGLTACEGSCVNVMSDPLHCGACAMPCKPGNVCMGGKCALSCAAPLSDCGGACVNIQTDAANCGACAMACPMGHACKGGKCELQCANNLTDCGGACANLQIDAEHCGDCMTVCKQGLLCKAGKCVANCAVGQSDCGGVCFNLLSDKDHCGDCMTACGPGKLCQNGACVGICGMGLTDCNGACANLNIDAANCGKCAMACGMSETCIGGKCLLPCQMPAKSCNNVCIDVRFDADNCGDCGKVCPTPANATRACFQGACTTMCKPGFFDCDNNAMNGCETKVDDDLSNCGSCAKVCPVGANGTPVCSNATCSLACKPTFLDCDKNSFNGCEIDSTKDAKNCGVCGTDCAGPNSSGSCVASKCMTMCNAGFGDCNNDPKDGCELDLLADVKNCGACGMVCPMNAPRCISGQCRNYPPPFAMWGNLNWYKIQVNGVMTDTNVKAACEALGLTVPCQIRGNCSYNGGNCNMKTPEMSCGNPMLGLAQAICNGQSPPQCAPLNGVYQYMGGNWNGNSSCGALNGSWCSAGNGVQNQFALCIEP